MVMVALKMVMVPLKSSLVMVALKMVGDGGIEE